MGVAALAPVQAENTLPDWALGGFVRPEGVNPLIEPKESLFNCPMKGVELKWECADTFNPAATVKDGKVCILYRAEDDPTAGIGGRTSRIGYAESPDGITITERSATPVFYPDNSVVSKTYEWKGGCEDPRVAVTEDGLYVMTYTSWNNNIARLSIATSRDLKNWEKQGPAFLTAHNGRFKDLFCKSGSIVTEVKDGKQVIAKVNGKYLMYWGENYVAAATSTDLVNWEPVLDEKGELLKLITPRAKHFDSNLTECGPPAVITDKGIVLLYNGKNASGGDQDQRFAANTYSAGQVLFDKTNPYKVLDRLAVPFFRPMADFEKSGQYAAGTVFIEGLVYHNAKWYLYYGCADSKVGVAVYDPANPAPGDPFEVGGDSDVISNYPPNGTGKRVAFVHSYSGKAGDGEHPFYLFYSKIDAGRKWCEISNERPWVIIELSDYYNLSRFVWRDATTREPQNGNVPEYWIYVSTTGTSDEDFGEPVIHKTEQGDVEVKDDRLDTPVEARYIKFVTTRGYRRDNGDRENGIRIYGMDIYGTYSREIDRGDVISVGKSILKFHDATNEREQPLNLLDGVTRASDNKWCFFRGAENDPNKYFVLDLEDQYDISKFTITDCRNNEGADNLRGYQIFVSKECPNLDLISPLEDGNTCWEQVIDTNGRGDEATKTDELAAPATGRYVKFVSNRDVNPFTARVFEFTVHGKLHESSTNGVESVSASGVAVYPTSIASGESVYVANSAAGATLAVYDLQGRCVASGKVAPGAGLSLALTPGIYVARATCGGATATTRLTVK